MEGKCSSRPAGGSAQQQQDARKDGASTGIPLPPSWQAETPQRYGATTFARLLPPPLPPASLIEFTPQQQRGKKGLRLAESGADLLNAGDSWSFTPLPSSLALAEMPPLSVCTPLSIHSPSHLQTPLSSSLVPRLEPVTPDCGLGFASGLGKTPSHPHVQTHIPSSFAPRLEPGNPDRGLGFAQHPPEAPGHPHLQPHVSSSLAPRLEPGTPECVLGFARGLGKTPGPQLHTPMQPLEPPTARMPLPPLLPQCASGCTDTPSCCCCCSNRSSSGGSSRFCTGRVVSDRSQESCQCHSVANIDRRDLSEHGHAHAHAHRHTDCHVEGCRGCSPDHHRHDHHIHRNHCHDADVWTPFQDSASGLCDKQNRGHAHAHAHAHTHEHAHACKHGHGHEHANAAVCEEEEDPPLPRELLPSFQEPSQSDTHEAASLRRRGGDSLAERKAKGSRRMLVGFERSGWMATELLGVVSFAGFSSRQSAMRRLALLLALKVTFTGAELALGLSLRRIELVSDAFNLSFGCGVLLLSLAAMGWGAKPADKHYTYGYERLQVLAAFTNALFLVFLSFSLFVECLQAMVHDEAEHRHSLVMSATLNMVVNLVGVVFFRKHAALKNANWNILDMSQHAVLLHLLCDSARSGGIVLSLFFIAVGWHGAEPLCLGAVAATVIALSLPLLRTSGDMLLLQTAPAGIAEEALDVAMRQVVACPGVVECCEHRFWAVVPGHVVGTVSLRVEDGADERRTVDRVRRIFRAVGIVDLGVHIETSQNSFHAEGF